MSAYLENLKEAITAAVHGCGCSHSGSVLVWELVEGENFWKGDVEIFDLQGHPEATLAFAWGWKGETQPRCTVVLNIPPISDPANAVKASIVSGQSR